MKYISNNLALEDEDDVEENNNIDNDVNESSDTDSESDTTDNVDDSEDDNIEEEVDEEELNNIKKSNAINELSDYFDTTKGYNPLRNVNEVNTKSSIVYHEFNYPRFSKLHETLLNKYKLANESILDVFKSDFFNLESLLIYSIPKINSNISYYNDAINTFKKYLDNSIQLVHNLESNITLNLTTYSRYFNTLGKPVNNAKDFIELGNNLKLAVSSIINTDLKAIFIKLDGLHQLSYKKDDLSHKHHLLAINERLNSLYTDLYTNLNFNVINRNFKILSTNNEDKSLTYIYFSLLDNNEYIATKDTSGKYAINNHHSEILRNQTALNNKVDSIKFYTNDLLSLISLSKELIELATNITSIKDNLTNKLNKLKKSSLYTDVTNLLKHIVKSLLTSLWQLTRFVFIVTNTIKQLEGIKKLKYNLSPIKKSKPDVIIALEELHNSTQFIKNIKSANHRQKLYVSALNKLNDIRAKSGLSNVNVANESIYNEYALESLLDSIVDTAYSIYRKKR